MFIRVFKSDKLAHSLDFSNINSVCFSHSLHLTCLKTSLPVEEEGGGGAAGTDCRVKGYWRWCH